MKFNGALILIIKLNTESASLSEDDARELLANLVGWYLDSLAEGTAPLVMRKLASALSTFLVHFHRVWPHFTQQLVACLAQGEPHPLSASTRPEDFPPALETLGHTQLKACSSHQLRLA